MKTYLSARVLLIFSSTLLWISSTSLRAQTNLSWFSSNRSPLSIQAPSNWKLNDKAQFLSIESPNGAVALTASAYAKNDGLLRDFAEYRFGTVEQFYKAQGAEQSFAGGVFREYEGTWPGEKTPTYYVVSARKISGGFVSLTVVTDRADFQRNKNMYVRIMESSRLGK